jgi:hypothetical protein
VGSDYLKACPYKHEPREAEMFEGTIVVDLRTVTGVSRRGYAGRRDSAGRRIPGCGSSLLDSRGNRRIFRLF